MNEAIKKWADWARDCGWQVEDDASGYTHFWTPEGEHAGRYPATPSNPHRRMLDLKVALTKHGLAIPPPSKKERKAQRSKAKQEKREQ